MAKCLNGTRQFLYERPGGPIAFDPEVLGRPEYQDLLRSLYEHYRRGATVAPLPFQIFPVRQMRQELLLQLVGGDVRTFVRLAASDPTMRQRLMPLTAQFVCQVWPDVALLLSVATDQSLLRRIERIGSGDPFAQGVTAMQLDEAYDEAGNVRAKSSSDWRAFYLFLDRAAALERGNENPLMLPSGHVCRFSDMAAIKLAAEVLAMGVQWRFTEEWRRRSCLWSTRRVHRACTGWCSNGRT